MRDQTRLDADLTFHSLGALHAALAEAGAPPDLGGSDVAGRSGWPILARLGEYAHADLDGLHVTGWIRGHLLTDFDDRLRALARYADGTICATGEAGSSWRIRLAHGHVTHDHVEPRQDDRSAASRVGAEPADRPGGGTGDRAARVGRIELHVTHGLAQVAVVPWIAEHTEELQHGGRQSGSITLTGVTTLDADTLKAGAPDGAWQAFCNADTATPGRWTGYHPAIGIVEAHHVDGLIAVPHRGPGVGAPAAPGLAAHPARLTQLLRLLDPPASAASPDSRLPTRAHVSDPLAHVPGGPTVLEPPELARTDTRNRTAR